MEKIFQSLHIFKKSNSFLIFLLACFVATADASDLEKEARWKDEVIAGLFDGEAVSLKTDQRPFLGIWMPAPNGTAIILMHGTGVHPDWPQVINPLRVSLAELGWASLSIQMPVLQNGASKDEYLAIYDEVPPRVNAAIGFLEQAGYAQVILLGHSQGAQMAAYHLATSEQAFRGFIAIGMPDSSSYLKQIDLPILDIDGEFDLDFVLRSRDAKIAASTHNSAYRQIQIDGADHFQEGYEDELIELIEDWMQGLQP